MQRLLVATSNPGKVREFAEALSAAGIEVVGLEALIDRTEVPETGETFEANARLKAEGYSRRTSLPVVADDSGLEVDALGGAPGVLSARYGGAGLDDRGRNDAVLKAIEGVPESERTARFRCALALAEAGHTLAVYHGVVHGRLLDAPRGDGGFGYDPLFFHPESGVTLAELTTAEKRRVSHRGQAIAALVAALRNPDATP